MPSTCLRLRVDQLLERTWVSRQLTDSVQLRRSPTEPAWRSHMSAYHTSLRCQLQRLLGTRGARTRLADTEEHHSRGTSIDTAKCRERAIMVQLTSIVCKKATLPEGQPFTEL
jgi:hypothetical protein